jgi:3-deoxy-D-manno-octulosonate 8-phosphate phosphatase (KDO 8-P phosphatase)
MSFTDACRRIELILSDVDGVMTDGGIRMLDDGRQIITFHIRDGMGVRLWREAGKKFGIVTGRDLPAVRRRAEDLKFDVVRMGIDDKLPAVDAIAAELGLTREQICFIGDDLLDLRAIQSVGFGVTVADAPEELRQAAKYTTSIRGGAGAIRELVEVILKNTDRWDDVVRRYSNSPS